MVTADWSTCTQASVVQSAATICGCGQQLPGTQRVQPSLLTKGDFIKVGYTFKKCPFRKLPLSNLRNPLGNT